MKTEGKYQRAVRMGEMTLEQAVQASGNDPSLKPSARNPDWQDPDMTVGGMPREAFMDQFTHYSDENGRDIGTGHGAFAEYQAGQGFDNANRFVMEHLAGLATTGTASMNVAQAIKLQSKGGLIKQAFSEPDPADEEDLPTEPGKAYLSHLFKYNKVNEKLKDMKKKIGGGANIYTDQPEALMSALNVVGLYSDKNPSGMPMDVAEALKLKFGNKEVDDVAKAEFMSIAEQGDTKIDPKRIRKFVNYDGSLTWEVLNEDKTVMSRFTMGKYNGTSIFAHGGYKKFAELLKKAKAQLGEDRGGEFDSIRSMFGG